MSQCHSPIMLALDVPSKEEALSWIKRMRPWVTQYKVGMRLFYKEGRDWLKLFADEGLNLFLDLKLYDIPNTVAEACESLQDIAPTYLTLHASGGQQMMQAAQSVMQETNTHLVAVTCLTSFSAEQLAAVYPKTSNVEPSQWVEQLAQLAITSGINHLVCSPQECAPLKQRFGDTIKLLTPGIRPADNTLASDDQQRTLTPQQALAAGSNLLIMGRPILKASNPEQTVSELLNSIQTPVTP